MSTKNGGGFRLELFISEDAGGVRVLARRTQLSRQLRAFFDDEGEAYPVPRLDFDDLKRFAKARNAVVQVRVSMTGGVALSAEGEGAALLGKWLARSFASGVR